MNRALSVLVFCILSTCPALAGDMPKLGKDEAMQLFGRAGFHIGGTTIRNRCGQPANPSISFTDLNGDGVDEAVFVDTGSCYASGHWLSILRQAAPRSWSLALMAEGVGQPVSARTEGWYDIALTTGGQTRVLHYNGRRYVTSAGRPPGYGPPTAREAAAPRAAQRSDASVASKLADADGAAVPRAVKSGELEVTWSDRPTPAQKAAVATALAEEAADARSDGHDLGYTIGTADLNGDGLLDLIVHLTDSTWCGSAGCGAEAILALPGGYAGKRSELGVNFVERMFVRSRMHKGMHDLRYDDSTHVFRWDGRQYR